MPVMMEVKPATIMVTPAPREVARPVMPTAIAVNPVPTRSSPAPRPAMPMPIKANAPPSPRMVGSSGVRSAPAVPITVKAPATLISPLAMASQLMLPRVKSTGVKTAKALAATSIAAEPASVPFIKFKPTASSARAPPMATRLFATASQLMPPIFPRASAKTFSAAPTVTSPAPVAIKFFGMAFMATATSAKAPPMASKPFPISAKDMPPKSAIAEANIFMAAPISIMARPVEISPCAFPVSFVNAVISKRTAPTELSPFTSSPAFICPKSLQAEAKTFIALARTRIPAAVAMAPLLTLTVFVNRETSAIRTPTPVKPFATPAKSSWARSIQAEASILIAPANTTIWADPLMTELEPLPKTLAAATSAVISPAIPARATTICSGSISEIFFRAEASRRTEVETPIMAAVPLTTPLTSPLIRLKMAMEAINSANSTVMAPREAVSLPLSIREMVTIAAASTAIAEAIFRRVPAFSWV